MKIRLFVAADIPQSMAEGFLDYQKSLAIEKVRWTREEDYHLTVAFLGYINDKNLGAVEKEVAEIAAKTTPFQLHHESVILAPPGKDATMIWAKLAPSGEFSNLVGKIYSNTKPYITEIVRTERIPHVTLARFRETEAINESNLVQPSLSERSFLVDKISLFESQPTETESIYKRLSNFQLQG